MMDLKGRLDRLESATSARGAVVSLKDGASDLGGHGSDSSSGSVNVPAQFGIKARSTENIDALTSDGALFAGGEYEDDSDAGSLASAALLDEVDALLATVAHRAERVA